MKSSLLIRSLGKDREVSLMHKFKQAMEIYSLHDLGHNGYFFTWSNRHETNTYTKERLNKAVANLNWSHVYNALRVKILVSQCFDHKPLLALCFSQAYGKDKRVRILRFETSWNLNEECSTWVEQSWNRRSIITTPWVKCITFLLTVRRDLRNRVSWLIKEHYLILRSNLKS